VNTNLHVTQRQAATMLQAVRYWLKHGDCYGQDYTDLVAARTMLEAALARISDAAAKQNKTGVWATPRQPKETA